MYQAPSILTNRSSIHSGASALIRTASAASWRRMFSPRDTVQVLPGTTRRPLAARLARVAVLGSDSARFTRDFPGRQTETHTTRVPGTGLGWPENPQRVS